MNVECTWVVDVCICTCTCCIDHSYQLESVSEILSLGLHLEYALFVCSRTTISIVGSIKYFILFKAPDPHFQTPYSGCVC